MCNNKLKAMVNILHWYALKYFSHSSLLTLVKFSILILLQSLFHKVEAAYYNDRSENCYTTR